MAFVCHVFHAIKGLLTYLFTYFDARKTVFQDQYEGLSDSKTECSTFLALNTKHHIVLHDMTYKGSSGC